MGDIVLYDNFSHREFNVHVQEFQTFGFPSKKRGLRGV